MNETGSNEPKQNSSKKMARTEMERLYDIYMQKKDYIRLSKTGKVEGNDIKLSEMSLTTSQALSKLMQSLIKNVDDLTEDLKAYVKLFNTRSYENMMKLTSENQEKEQVNLEKLLKKEFKTYTPLSNRNFSSALNRYKLIQGKNKNRPTTLSNRIRLTLGLTQAGGSISKRKSKKRRETKKRR